MFGITNSFIVEEVASRSWPLLWENPNPTSNFSAQTVSIDLSDWKYIMINYKNTADGTHKNNSIIKVGDITTLTITPAAGTLYHYLRQCTVSTTGITFTTGYRNNTGTTGVKYCIPLEVYGVPGSNAVNPAAWVTLWENPSINVPFEDSTIPINLTAYNTIAIETLLSVSSSGTVSDLRCIHFVRLGTTGIVASPYNLQGYYKLVAPSSTGVVITTMPSNNTAAKRFNIPTAIFGVN